MKEYKFIIDASHGGDDKGVTGNNIIEKDYSLLISNYIYDKLKSLGYKVSMTRTTDETISNEQRINRALEPFGSSNDVIIISNHLNSGGEEGVEIVYALRDNNKLPNDISDAMEKAGIDVSKVFQRRLPSDTAKDYYFIQRDTKNTIPISIYYGYIDNSNDANNLKNNYGKYGDAVVDGILAFLGANETSDNQTYVVKSGDSLWSISKKFNISVEDLKKANNLSNNLLTIGQVLKIPSVNIPPQIGDFVVYTVSAGDTLYKIASRYNLTIDDIVDYNDLSSTNLQIGQQLFIPVTKDTNDQIYVVKSGDTLYGIANKYGISVAELKKYNNLSTNKLNIGDKLNIPVKDTSSGEGYVNYIVKSGDSLYSIANRYNTTVTEIMKLNNLSTSLLRLGQVLKIPTSDKITYIVKSGDNLYSIANKYNTTIDSIKRKNNLTNNNLSIGQILII